MILIFILIIFWIHKRIFSFYFQSGFCPDLCFSLFSRSTYLVSWRSKFGYRIALEVYKSAYLKLKEVPTKSNWQHHTAAMNLKIQDSRNSNMNRNQKMLFVKKGSREPTLYWNRSRAMIFHEYWSFGTWEYLIVRRIRGKEWYILERLILKESCLSCRRAGEPSRAPFLRKS